MVWVNFQCRGVPPFWIRVGQRHSALAVDADGGCLDILTFVYHFSFLSPSLWETARYGLKYCRKGPLSLKQTKTKKLESRGKKSHSCRFGIIKVVISGKYKNLNKITKI